MFVGGSDPGFPGEKIFRRLGSKKDLVEKVLQHCRGKPEYADVVLICEADLATLPPKSGRVDGVSPTTLGFVYLVKGHRGEYKIGRSGLVGRRVAELGTTSSVALELVHEIKTDDPAGVEGYWHRRFEGSKLRGEWFKLTSRDVAAFKRWNASSDPRAY